MADWLSQTIPDPCDRLNLNDSLPATPWARKQRRELTRLWRHAGWAAGCSRVHPLITGIATVTVEFGTSRVNQRRDPSNWMATTKHLIDGLTDARFWPDDDRAHVREAPPVFTNAIPPLHFRIHITWEEEGGDVQD